MNTNICKLDTIVNIAVIALLVYLLYMMKRGEEQLCFRREYGTVTDIPASSYADANSALVRSSSLGQAPLGDPRYWLPNRNPITQGQYGLYQNPTLPIGDTQPFDRRSLLPEAQALPVYTNEPLPTQCTPLE